MVCTKHGLHRKWFYILSDMETPSFRTVLCIPGPWTKREDLLSRIVDSSAQQYFATGTMMLNRDTNEAYEFEVSDRADEMRSAFHYAGLVNHLSDDFLDEVDEHNCVVYLIGETGSMESARAIALAGKALLEAGGIGIKVETAGKAFSKSQWDSMLEDFEEARLYEMFVLDCITSADGTVHTCGMQNLGLKDSIVSGLPFEQAAELLEIFGFYQVVEKPEIQPGQTFSTAVDAPIFEIEEETEQPYAGNELFGNPFGMWRLRGVE